MDQLRAKVPMCFFKPLEYLQGCLQCLQANGFSPEWETCDTSDHLIFYRPNSANKKQKKRKLEFKLVWLLIMRQPLHGICGVYSCDTDICFFMCLLRVPDCVHAKLHFSQAKVFSPVWENLWVLSLLASLQVKLHSLHEKGFSPVCCIMWFFRWPGRLLE